MNVHDRALEVLHRDGHTKGQFQDYWTGGRCAMDCYRAVISINADYSENLLQANAEFLRALAELGITVTIIAHWNDRPETTADDVAHVMKRASELHELAKEKK